MEYLTNHFSYACQDFETTKNPRYSLCTSYFQGLSPEYSQPIRCPAFFRYLLREKITYFGCKKRKTERKKERKEKEKKILVRSSSNLRIPYSALIVLKELFKVSSGLKLLFSAYNLIIHKMLWELERRYQQISSAMTDHNTFFSPNFCRHSSKTWKSWFKFLNFQSISICTIRSNRRQETVSMPLIYSPE